MALISVIIPAYNQAEYLSMAIQSALDQGFSDVEIVVVDDGSTDNTQDVLARFEDSRLRTIRQQNGGLLSARNRALDDSSAPFVTFLDADDMMSPGGLSLMYTRLRQDTETGMIAGGVEYINQNGKVLGGRTSEPQALHVSALLLDNPIIVSGVLLRREWLELVGGFENRRDFDPCGDWDLWLRLVTAGCKIDWLGSPVIAYRLHPKQMTQDPHKMRDAMVAVLDKYFEQENYNSKKECLKRRAYAVVFIKSAARGYQAGKFDIAGKDLAKAIDIDESLRADDFRDLAYRLVGWAYAPQSIDPEIYLENIRKNLPFSLTALKQVLRKEIAKVILTPIFISGVQDNRGSKRTIIRAIRRDPSWLLNRGVIRRLLLA